MAKSGFVYCIANEAMPGLVKIGATARDPAERLAEARHATWAPSCFRITAQVAVDDAFGTERVIHALLSQRRFEARREFFRLTHEEARAVFAVVEIIAGHVQPQPPASLRAVAPTTAPAPAPPPALSNLSDSAHRREHETARAWVHENCTRVSEPRLGTKLRAIYEAYRTQSANTMGRNEFAACLKQIYPGVRRRSAKEGDRFLIRVN